MRPGRHELREYQKKALNCIYSDLQKESNVLMQGATGCGKTLMFCRLVEACVKRSDKKIIILVHKKELVEQIHKTLLGQTEVKKSDIGICCAGLGKKIINRHIVAGTVQTFANNLKPNAIFDLMIIDEAHLIKIGTSSQYDIVINNLRAKKPDMRIFGCTATPHRLGMGYIYGPRHKPGTRVLFPRLNHKILYKDLEAEGFLMPLQASIKINKSLKVDLKKVDVKGDYVLSQLGETMSRVIHIQTAVDAVEEYARGSDHICVFACTISHARKLETAMLRKYPDNVTIVHSKLTKSEREKNLSDWKTGEKRIIISINILTEGFDFPALDCILMARPTKSSALYIQTIGRVLRICDGKARALLIDLTDNTTEFGPDAGIDLDNINVKTPGKSQRLGVNEKNCREKLSLKTSKAHELPPMKTFLFNYPKAQLLDVKEMFLSKHYVWRNKRYCVRLDFDCGRNVSKYFHLQDYYNGLSVKEAEKDWRILFDEPFPKSVEELPKKNTRVPKKIWVDIINGFNTYMRPEF